MPLEQFTTTTFTLALTPRNAPIVVRNGVQQAEGVGYSRTSAMPPVITMIPALAAGAQVLVFYLPGGTGYATLESIRLISATAVSTTITLTARTYNSTRAVEYSLDGTTYQSGNTFMNVAVGIYAVRVRLVGTTITAGAQVTVSATATVQYITLPYLQPTVDITASASSTGGIQLNRTANSGPTWGRSIGAKSIGYRGAPGLQGRLRINSVGVAANLADSIISLNTAKVGDQAQVQHGIYFNATATAAVVNGALNPATPRPYQSGYALAGLEIWAYDDHTDFLYSYVANAANTVLLYTDPTPPVFPLIPSILLKNAGLTQIQDVSIAAYVILDTVLAPGESQVPTLTNPTFSPA